MKKIAILLLMLTAVCHDVGAVLKERNLDETLGVLRRELTDYHRELTGQMENRREESRRIGQQLMSIMKRSNQNALMLYSQKQDYVFDLTYACHEATEQYRSFQAEQLPIKNFIKNSSVDIARYDSLIYSLKIMQTSDMADSTKVARNVCLTLATSIRNILEENNSNLQDYIRYYEMTENRLSSLNDYANIRYNDIQTSIFRNGGEDYFTLMRNIRQNWQSMVGVTKKKYNFRTDTSESQWGARWIVGLFVVILIYIFFATALNLLAMRYLVPSRVKTEEFSKKRSSITMATTTVTFAIILGFFIRNTGQNFLAMASNLLVEYAWLLSVILISLLLRVSGSQIGSAFRIYSPLLVVGFLVIAFRIVLIPNELVTIIFPPILLLSALWQWHFIRKYNHNVPRSDMFYTYMSLTVFVVAIVCSWIGYTLLAVQILIWWIMQLTCILTITCLSQWMKLRGQRLRYSEKPITKTWAFHLVYNVALPTLGVLSVMVSIYWAADVFNLSSLCWDVFNRNYVNLDNLRLSIMSVSVVVSLWFLFNYLNKTVKALMKLHFDNTDPSTAESRMMMAKNVVQVIVWGAWFIIALKIMHVSYTWLVVISGGLSTGVGFAMKDILENIYYGISLMAGRIKVGDWIEVDGTMGRVSSISYTNTTVDSLYGEVISFQNSQLFTKNYKNLTRNHGYVLAVIPFGVAYGSDVHRVMELVNAAVTALSHKWVDRSKQIKSVVSELGDSSVNFKMFVWAEAPKKSYVISDVVACIYDTLNKNGIEIPFPQRDIHIKEGAVK